MDVFVTILLKLIPLYLIIGIGYIAAKKLYVQKESIARLLLYIIVPVVAFYGASTTEISLSNISLPLLFFLLASLISLLFLRIGTAIFKNDSTKNILAFTAGTGNTGYFGIPVILSVFGEEAFSLAIMAVLGFLLYENSLGFYIIAKGNYTVKESIRRVLRLPIIYACFLGIFCNIFNITFGNFITSSIVHFKGAYTLLGMMIIGMGLATVTAKHIDVRFIALAFFAKFIVWPLIILLIIFLNENFLHIYSPNVYKVFMILATVPLAASTVTISTELKVHPDKAALAVLLSTFFALFFIPLMMSLFKF